jgi:hypothetical protein
MLPTAAPWRELLAHRANAQSLLQEGATLPITAYSVAAQRELDLGQWLTLNGYQGPIDSQRQDLPELLREKATGDIECSCCAARGAKLIRDARSGGTGKRVAQGHFRFVADDGSNPHHPLCDFFEESKVRGAEYQVSFTDAKSSLTKLIRDLVCRGITAGLFTAADMRAMRLWFHQEKAAHSKPLVVKAELLRWCTDMQDVRSRVLTNGVPFVPEHGSLPGFNWALAAKEEWLRRNEPWLASVDRIIFSRQVTERSLRLVALHGGQLVLDPSALASKYDAAVQLARFAAIHMGEPGSRPPALASQHHSAWGPEAHALLALSALLLYVSGWDLKLASVLFCRIRVAPPATEWLHGNLIGLNPFHDHLAWRLIAAAREVGARRTDDRPVAEQIDAVKAELEAQFRGARAGE